MYQNRGPSLVKHIDGYDKLMPFGFPIHGARYCGRRLEGNSKISRLFLDWILQIGRVPKNARLDAATDNVLVKDIQIALRRNYDDIRTGCISYIESRSRGNQRMDAFWRFIKKNYTVGWRNLFKETEDNGPLSTSEYFENIRL